VAVPVALLLVRPVGLAACSQRREEQLERRLRADEREEERRERQARVCWSRGTTRQREFLAVGRGAQHDRRPGRESVAVRERRLPSLGLCRAASAPAWTNPAADCTGSSPRRQRWCTESRRWAIPPGARIEKPCVLAVKGARHARIAARSLRDPRPLRHKDSTGAYRKDGRVRALALHLPCLTSNSSYVEWRPTTYPRRDRCSRPVKGVRVAKVRVYELAKEFGVESKAVMAKLQEMGEFVRSASSTLEPSVVRRLKEAFQAGNFVRTTAPDYRRPAGRPFSVVPRQPSPPTATLPRPAAPAPRPAAPALRPGPRPGNNPFSSTATGVDAPHPGTTPYSGTPRPAPASVNNPQDSVQDELWLPLTIRLTGTTAQRRLREGCLKG
jgi:Translation initiation factor IF-2, N-terminal region